MAEAKKNDKKKNDAGSASKSQHDSLRKRVDTLEAQMAAMAARIGVNPAELG